MLYDQKKIDEINYQIYLVTFYRFPSWFEDR
jgi:hypothetical protein